MPVRAMICYPPGLLNGPLLYRERWYHVEADGALNPQPTPDAFVEMAGCGHTFTVRDISEERAAQLEWPDEWAQPPASELDPSAPRDLQPGTIEDPEAYAAALADGRIAEVTDEPEAVDLSSLSWHELRAMARAQGIKAKSRDQVIRDLAGTT